MIILKLVKIRDYTADDWVAIETMLRLNTNLQFILPDHEKKLINHYIQQNESGRTFVAQDGATNALVGYIILRFYRHSVFIENIVVDPKYQNQGVGNQLLEFAKKLSLLDSPNMEVLRVAVPEDNQGAIRFFIENKFVVCGYIKSDSAWYINTVHFAYPLIDTTF